MHSASVGLTRVRVAFIPNQQTLDACSVLALIVHEAHASDGNMLKHHAQGLNNMHNQRSRGNHCCISMASRAKPAPCAVQHDIQVLLQSAATCKSQASQAWAQLHQKFPCSFSHPCLASCVTLQLQAARSGEQQGAAQMWGSSPTRIPTCRWCCTSPRTALHSSLCRYVLLPHFACYTC